MAFVSSWDMVLDAYEGNYAIPAFNFENLEMAQAIISAAESFRSPVILQTTPSSVTHLGMKQAVAIVRSIAEQVKVPVALHLDHCESFEEIIRAIHNGYTSVMIDASKLAFEDNIFVTRNVVLAAHAAGITVESELGKVGGKEDNLIEEHMVYTEPDEAEEFVKKTGTDFFAPAIGTAHGFYKGSPQLDFDRLFSINERVRKPLVLHGGSGIPDEAIKTSIKLGISKINFATELRFAATNAVREVLKNEEVFDPKKYMSKAREAVQELCLKKIRICGSYNKV